jgi:DNA-binding CsgD family transcriptional regulator
VNRDRDHDTDLPLPNGAQVEFLADDLAVLSFPLPTPRLPAVLTEAEREVARLVYAGARNDDIARARGVSLKTVANQLDSIYRKLGVGSRSELVLSLRGDTDEG